MKKIRLVVEKREAKRSGACGRLRKRGLIPAVIYGRSGAKNLQVGVANFRQMMQMKGNSASFIELVCGHESSLAMLQAYQRNPREDHYIHVDFKEIDAHETLRTTLPIRVLGEAEGVKNYGGILEILNHAVVVECLPENLPECIELNVGTLQLGHSIHVKDLPQMQGVTYKTPSDVVIVSCVKVAEEEEEANKVELSGTTEATADGKNEAKSSKES
ncbi:MAG: 50S ribosomal protein L25 [Puniceicoccales bacterium]|jgi:large subunit ribosomal protein L25|nr:50S ribosomal protein L25 [Puniceicoccales bacterium]